MSLLRQTSLLLWKDVVVELRAKELVYATVFFATIVILVFAFAFMGGVQRPPLDVLSGVLWVTIALSGTVGISRAFEREREGDTLRALLLSPAPRQAIYLSKLASITLLMLTVELVASLLVSLLFSVTLRHLGLLAGLLVLGTVGFAAVAALFGASLGRARSRDVLLPLLTYPVVIPVLIAGARGTVGILRGEPEDLAVSLWWLKFLGVFDIIFVSVGMWLFEPVMRGES